MRAAFAALAVVAALTFASSATAITYPNSVLAPSLEAKLPTRVTVYCTANTNYDFAVLWAREIYLDVNVCAELAGRPSQYSFGRALHILMHEWWHVAFQEVDEKRTECGAYAIDRWAMRHFWHLTAAQAQQQYEYASGWSPYAPLPCAPNAHDPLLDGGS